MPGGLGKNLIPWIHQIIKEKFKAKSHKIEKEILSRTKIMSESTVPGFNEKFIYLFIL